MNKTISSDTLLNLCKRPVPLRRLAPTQTSQKKTKRPWVRLFSKATHVAKDVEAHSPMGEITGPVNKLKSKAKKMKALNSQKMMVSQLSVSTNELIRDIKNFQTKSTGLSLETKTRIEDALTKLDTITRELRQLNKKLAKAKLNTKADVARYTALLGGAIVQIGLDIAEVSSKGLGLSVAGVSVAIEGYQFVKNVVKTSDLKKAKNANSQLAKSETQKLAELHTTLAKTKISDEDLTLDGQPYLLLEASSALNINAIQKIAAKTADIISDLEKLNSGQEKLSAKSKRKHKFDLEAFLEKVDSLKQLCDDVKAPTIFTQLNERIHNTLTCHLAAQNYSRQVSELHLKKIQHGLGIGIGVTAIACAATGVGAGATIGLAVGFVLMKVIFNRAHAHREQVTEKKANQHPVDDTSTKAELYTAALNHNSDALARLALMAYSTTTPLQLIGPNNKPLTTLEIMTAGVVGKSPFDERKTDATQVSTEILDTVSHTFTTQFRTEFSDVMMVPECTHTLAAPAA